MVMFKNNDSTLYKDVSFTSNLYKDPGEVDY